MHPVHSVGAQSVAWMSRDLVIFTLIFSGLQPLSPSSYVLEYTCVEHI